MTTTKGYRAAEDIRRRYQNKRWYVLQPFDEETEAQLEAERVHDLEHLEPERRAGCHMQSYGSLRKFIEECVRSGEIYTLNARTVAQRFGVSKCRVRQLMNTYGIYGHAGGRPKQKEPQP